MDGHSEKQPDYAFYFQGKFQGPDVKAVEPIDFDGVETLSFRQIDSMNGVRKGTAFRFFKRLRGELREGRDYYYLPQHSQGAFIQSLRETEQVYHSTTHLVLITRFGYQRLQWLNAGTERD